MANRVCWNCEITANQKFVGLPITPSGETAPRTRESRYRFFHAATCNGCGCASLAEILISHQELNDRFRQLYGVEDARRDPTPEDFRKRITALFDDGHVGMIWHPAYAQGKDFPDVPAYVASPASEAWACFNVGLYRAAAVMARAVVEATAKEKGANPGDNLVKKVEFLADNDHLSRRVVAAADEIRQSGNDAAHANPVEPINEESCLSILTFMELVLHDVYQLDAKVARVSDLREAGRAKATD